LIVTWFVDLIWMFYWIPHWNSDEMKDWQKGLHNFVILFSVVNFLMKMAVIIMLGFTQRDTLRKGVTQMQNIRKGNTGAVEV
jgi:hypothetical protein